MTVCTKRLECFDVILKYTSFLHILIVTCYDSAKWSVKVTQWVVNLTLILVNKPGWDGTKIWQLTKDEPRNSRKSKQGNPQKAKWLLTTNAKKERKEKWRVFFFEKGSQEGLSFSLGCFLAFFFCHLRCQHPLTVSWDYYLPIAIKRFSTTAHK